MTSRIFQAAQHKSAHLPFNVKSLLLVLRFSDPKRHSSKTFATKSNAKNKLKDALEQRLDFSFDSYNKQMESKTAYFEKSLHEMGVGKANPAILEKLVIKHQGKQIKLNSIAQIYVKDAHTLMMTLPDQEIRNLVEKSLRGADLGLNPQKIQATELSIPVPKVTGAARAQLVKQIKEMGEREKVGIRMIRQKARTELLPFKKTVAPELYKKWEKLVETRTDFHVKKIQTSVGEKEKQIV